jgi:hypothetical protein
MDLRKALKQGNVGLAAAMVVIVVGLAVTGFAPTDTELQIVCWSALAVGAVVLVGLGERDERRARRDAARKTR